MSKAPLKYGFTTGACAAAAAKGAALMLRDRRLIDEVEINLPAANGVKFRLHGQHLTANGAACYVVKDAGDDPDVTNGAEIHADVSVEFFTPHAIVLQGGEGIGRVTKPGLAVKPGEWAINPVPRSMIFEGVKEVLAMRCIPATFTITISIPNGRELAKKTLNERLGIVGGLSILGTTGIVKPISTKAWTDTLDCAIDVALASGSETVILSTGRTSELVADKKLSGQCPEECYVMMGDHVGYALQACEHKGVKEVIVAGQFAKLLKIACGHEQTHVSSSELDLQELARWCAAAPATARFEQLCQSANTARQVLVDSEYDASLMELVCRRTRAAAVTMAPELSVRVLLAGYHGEMLYFA
ncbi:MAG: cobalt-precorrin-5B (C(1))-methyltransferase [Geobacter sp.]|nr:cobalt-precorrin-5B (C(1))-methyltransferase [Geobacter sp.]